MYNPVNAELNPICHLLSLLVAHHILHVSGLRVKEMFQLTHVVFCFIYDCSIRPQKIGLDHCILHL